jgi:hypothetical protein
MFRVLKPGGEVINVEMYVDLPPEPFTQGFEQVGFTTTDVRLLKRYDSLIEDGLKSRRWPRTLVSVSGRAWGAWHYLFANPYRTSAGLRDYLFFWSKPESQQ